MPKQMFFNISEEKRTKFLEAAIKEFTSKSFEQVSVNTIVKEAGISRGSFYTYFDDLESLFHYIFRTVKEKRIIYAKKIYLEANGDYFKFIRNLFMYDFEAYTKENKYTLFRNYIHYIQTVKRGSIKKDILMSIINEFKLKDIDIYSHLSQNKYGLTIEEMLDVFEVVFMIMINTLIKAENEELSKEAVTALFNKRLDYIEFGIEKRGSQ